MSAMALLDNMVVTNGFDGNEIQLTLRVPNGGGFDWEEWTRLFEQAKRKGAIVLSLPHEEPSSAPKCPGSVIEGPGAGSW